MLMFQLLLVTMPAQSPAPAPGPSPEVRWTSPAAERQASPHGQIRPSSQRGLAFFGVTPYLDGKPIGLVTFYTEIGRYDLVEDYYRTKRIKNVMLIGGAVGFGLATAGFYLGYLLWIDDLLQLEWNDRPTLFTERGGAVMLISIGVGLASIVTAVIGYFLDPQPLSPIAARALFDSDRQTGAEGPTSWRLGPMMTKDGGGVALSARF